MSDLVEETTDVEVKQTRKEQLAEARKAKADKKRRREEQLSNIESRLDTLLKQKETVQTEHSEDVEVEDQPENKKIKVTKEQAEESEDEVEGWGTTIFRACTPILVAGVPILLPVISSYIQRNLEGVQQKPIDNRPQVLVPPKVEKAVMPPPVSRVQKPYQTPTKNVVVKPKIVGNSGFVV